MFNNSRGVSENQETMENFVERVCRVVAAIPRGEVMTYGEVAAEAGRPGAARAVGGVMARHGSTLPWWRVVLSTGRLAPGHEERARRRLEREGVRVVDGRVRFPRETRVTPAPATSTMRRRSTSHGRSD